MMHQPRVHEEVEIPRPTASIRVGTRGSLLARTQATWVVEQLRRRGHAVELVTIVTQGDSGGDVPIPAIGGEGVFVRELERALLERRIDAAVHSLKDLPTEDTSGLALGCVPERALPFDVLVARESCTLESLPKAAVVGTSSIRRVAQVKALRDDLLMRPIRGNVDSRLRRLDAGEYDALVLAGAGLERLGLAGRITQVLRPDSFWPAVSQGALGIQIRDDDRDTRELLRPLEHPATRAAISAERSFLATLAGGCLAPVGAWGREGPEGRLEIGGCVLEDLGHRIVRIAASIGPAEVGPGKPDVAPESIGRALAERLREQGADAMLERMRRRVDRP